MRTLAVFVAAALGAGAACTGNIKAPTGAASEAPDDAPVPPGPAPSGGGTGDGTPQPRPATPDRTASADPALLAKAQEAARAAVSGPEAATYARRLVTSIAGRTLTPDELGALERGGAALRPMIEAWLGEAGFAETAKSYVSLKLKASGQRDGVDLDLPGNLAAYLVRNRRPHRELLTADFCVDGKGGKIACDTGAPYAAGVLGTRAFLANNASRFNLKRARTTMQTFACLDYPMPQTVQPSLPRDVLIPLFQTDKPPDGTAGAFGNGHACYACHSQFGAHAQLFVRFDEAGKWHADATGAQDPQGEPGRSTGALFTSHMLRAEEASSEASQVFGKRVANLPEAARVMADHPRFLSCSTRSLLGFAFGLPDSALVDIPDEVIDDVVAAARRAEPEPTLARLALEAFTHPAVIRSWLAPPPAQP